MNQILRSLEAIHTRIGAMGSIGIALLFMCLVGIIGFIQPLQTKATINARELAWLLTQPTKKSSTENAVPQSEEALVHFYSQFPPAKDLSKILKQIHQEATSAGVTLFSGEYKLTNDSNNPRIMRYEIIFPINANYANLKKFIQKANEQFPTLGLSDISIKRDSIGADSAQIKLRYVLLLAKSV